MTENGNMYMPVAPAYAAGNGGGFGFDGFGGGWGLLILLAVLGWGNGGFGFGGGGNQAANADMQRGFNHAAVMDGMNAMQGAISGGFAGVNAAIANGFAQAEIANNARQMADMQQVFALQSAMQNCCCENRAGVADLKYTVATEACADRSAVTNALRDVLEANSASTQRILDQMCQDKIDAKNEKIADLQNQLNIAAIRDAAGANTSRILADNAAQTAALEQYLAPVPRPAYVVQNPNCCAGNFGTCGCAA